MNDDYISFEATLITLGLFAAVTVIICVAIQSYTTIHKADDYMKGIQHCMDKMYGLKLEEQNK